MSQIVGLIELERDGHAVADLAAPCDDATLDELFARLVHGFAADDEAEGDGTVELPANLNLLCEDLSLVARRMQQTIFLARGSRR